MQHGSATSLGALWLVVFSLFLYLPSAQAQDTSTSPVTSVSTDSTDTTIPTSTPIPTPIPTSTSSSASESLISTSSTTSAYTGDATIYYPAGPPEVNNIDAVQVAWQSPWQNTNISVYCKGNAPADMWDQYEINDVDIVPGAGEFTLSPIEADVVIPQDQLPATCHMQLREAAGTSAVYGAIFIMTRTTGIPTTYADSTSTTSSSSSTSELSQTANTTTSSSEFTTLTSISSSTTQIMTSSPSSTSSPTVSATPTPTSTAISSPSVPAPNNRGSIAAIAIASTLGFIVLFFGFLFFFLRRRRRLRQASKITQTDEPPPMYVRHREDDGADYSDKDYQDSLLKVAGKPPTRDGGRVVVDKELSRASTTGAPSTAGAEDDGTGNRGSGDWKKFFKGKGRAWTGRNSSSRSSNGSVVAGPAGTWNGSGNGNGNGNGDISSNYESSNGNDNGSKNPSKRTSARSPLSFGARSPGGLGSGGGGGSGRGGRGTGAGGNRGSRGPASGSSAQSHRQGRVLT